MSPSTLITFPNGEVYRRTGECDGCQRHAVTAKCCRYVFVAGGVELTEDIKLWLALHGLDENVPRDQRIEQQCLALTGDGRCSVHGTALRPALCERYPEHPTQLDEGCSYQLETVKEPQSWPALLPSPRRRVTSPSYGARTPETL